MRRRLLIILGVLGFGALSLAVVMFYPAPEARYHGKSAKAWAKQAMNQNGEATAALRALGTNAVPDLIDLLHTQDSYLHKRAWLWQTKLAPRLRQAVLGKLEPPLASADRIAAARALGIIGPAAREALPALGQALHDRNFQVCIDVTSAMGQIGSDSLPYLILAAKDTDPNRRRAAVGAIGQITTGAEAAVPTLIELLRDPDEMVRQRAEYALKNLGAPWISNLIEIIATGPSGAREVAARELLVMYRIPFKASKALIEMMHDSRPQTRRQAIETLRVIQPVSQLAINAFTESLRDSDREVRLAAVKALGETAERGKSAIEPLMKLLEDKDESVKAAAKEAIRKIEGGTD